MSTKARTLFEHVSNVFQRKDKWKDLSESDKKSFSTYMVNRFISMHMDFLPFIADMQLYTMSVLSPAQVHDLYVDVFPKQKFFVKYIKGEKDVKFNKELIVHIATSAELPTTEVEWYLHYLLDNGKFESEITEYLMKYGKTKSEIKKMIKVEGE